MDAQVVTTLTLPSNTALWVDQRKLPFKTAEIKILAPPAVEIVGLPYSHQLPMFCSLVINGETVLTARAYRLWHDDEADLCEATFNLTDCIYVSDSLSNHG